MRTLLAAAALAVASPVMAADLPTRGQPWSLYVKKVVDGRTTETHVEAVAYGSGWRLAMACSTVDAAGRILSRRELDGVAVTAGRFVRGLLPGGSFTVYFPPSDEAPAFLSSYQDCAAGHVVMGSGD
jgi:hypothetical protein